MVPKPFIVFNETQWVAENTKKGALQSGKPKMWNLGNKWKLNSEQFTELTQEYDIKFLMRLINQGISRTLFEFPKLKASTMTYCNIIGNEAEVDRCK